MRIIEHNCRYTKQHTAVLIIFPLNLQTSITAQILSSGAQGACYVKEGVIGEVYCIAIF